MDSCRASTKPAFRLVREQCLSTKKFFQEKTAKIRTKVKEALLTTNNQTDDMSQDVCLTLDGTAISKLGPALTKMRQLESTKAQCETDLEACENAIREIHDQKFDPAYKLAGIKRGVRTAPESFVERLQTLVNFLDDKLAEFEKRREELEQAIEQANTSLRKRQTALATAMDNFFVIGGVLEEKEDAEPTISAALVDSFELVDERQAEWEEIDPQITSVPKGPNAESQRSKYGREERLKQQYESARAILNQADADFELRDEHFAQDRADREAARDKGEAVASTLSLDLEELQETQRLTRELAEAEEAAEKAKEAAIAAGVDLADSDLESGFVDNVEDGYRMSQEAALESSVDRKRVSGWLEEMPDSFTEPHSDGTRDVDDWDAESVGLCDSISMVAEGAERRRIDKWAVTAMARAAVDG